MNNEALAELLGLTAWRDPMLAVPRELFVPAVGLACPENGPSYPIDRTERPDEWSHSVYSDASIITQRADGQGKATAVCTGVASSSISAPGIAFRFLDLLVPRDHDRVLEIGTGTGYTAAVLSARLGDTNVTTVEVDPQVAEQAAANLAAAEFSPRLVVGDGASSDFGGGLFDRVHATCAVAEVPYSWVELTRPGGVIVVPWQPHRDHGLILRLTVAGAEAYGRFHGTCGYMMLRDHRGDTRWHPHDADEADRTSTRLDPRSVDEAGPVMRLVATARAPGLGIRRAPADDGSFSLLLFEIGNPEGSWAACDFEPGAESFDVHQYGERRLWDELEDAFCWWVEAGCPEAGRFGLTVSAGGERLWLDHSSRRV